MTASSHSEAPDPSSSGAPPVHWPSLSAAEAAYEWEDLRAWVQQFQQRYPSGQTLPSCWWRHPHIVELLAALRDHERASYARSAPSTAAMEWQQARHQAEVQLDLWIKRLTCGVPGRGHPPLAGPDGESEWAAHVRQDVERRQQIAMASNPRRQTL